jgi:hypothetical protein
MPNTLKQYTKEELWGVYNKLPPELQQTIFSGETADQIFAACERHEVQEVSKVAYNVGLVLLGVLLPSQLENTLVQQLNIEKQTAQGIMADINRFVFYPVKQQIEQIHRAPGETPQQQEGKDLLVPTPRHSDRAGTPQETPEETDDYMAAEPQEKPAEEEPAEKPVFSEEQGQEDPYREKAE